MDKTHFFLMIAAIAGVAGATILAFKRPLQPMLQSEQDAQASGGGASPAL